MAFWSLRAAPYPHAEREDYTESNMNNNETDAWWGGYSIRSMLPGMAASLLLSCLIWATVWLTEISKTGFYVVLVLMTLFWLGLISSWAYRMFGFNYRLTTRRLFHERGLLRRKVRQLSLDQVTDVVVKHGPFDRFLHVGQVHVAAHGSAPQSVVLQGVFAPEHLAEKILALSRAAR